MFDNPVNKKLSYSAHGKYAETEPLYLRALAIWEKALGPDHADVALVCHSLAELYRKIDKKEEAEKLEERARKISSLS